MRCIGYSMFNNKCFTHLNQCGNIKVTFATDSKVLTKDQTSSNLHTILIGNEISVGRPDGGRGVDHREAEPGQDQDSDLVGPAGEGQLGESVDDAEALQEEEGEADEGEVAQEGDREDARRLVLKADEWC